MIRLLILLVMINQAWAADFYVRKGATGANNGTSWTDAWNEFGSVRWGAVACGDTIWVAGGTYTQTLAPLISCNSSQRLTIAAARVDGTAVTGAAGWNSAYASTVHQTGGNAAITFDGSYSGITISGRTTAAGGTHGWWLDRAGTSGGYGIGLNAGGANNNVFEYMDLSGPGSITYASDGRAIDCTPPSAVSGNRFSNLNIWNWESGAYAVNCNSAVFEYIDMFDINAVNWSTYHPNGIIIWSSASGTVRYSKFHKGPNGFGTGEGVFFEQSGASSGWTIYGNLFYDLDQTGWKAIEITSTNANTKIFNNTFSNIRVSPGEYSASCGSGSEYRNNLFLAAVPGSCGTASNNVVAVSASVFVNRSAHDYHIIGQTGSGYPRGAGMNLSAYFSTDMDGTMFGQDGSWSSGAYAYNSGVTPSGGVSTVRCTPNLVTPPNPTNCSVTLTTPAPATGASVNLVSDQPAFAVPSTVSIGPDSTTGSLVATTSAVTVSTVARLTATLNASQATTSVTLTPAAQVPAISALSCSPSILQAAGNSTCTVALTNPAPGGGTSVLLADDSAVVAVPASVLVPSGQNSAVFTATAGSFSSSSNVTITATLNGASRSVVLSLTASTPNVPASLSRVTCTSGTFSSPGNTLCLLEISGPAPRTGFAVTLSSSNSSVSVPQMVTIPAGATSANFTAQVGSFSAASSATITASAAQPAVSKTFTLSLQPPGSSMKTGLVVDFRVSGNQNRSITSVTTPAFTTRAANELLLAFVTSDYISGRNSTVTKIAGGSLTWVLVVRANRQNGTSEIWRALAPSPISGATVTATLSQAVTSSITIVGILGASTAGSNGSDAIGSVAAVSSHSGAPKASLTTTRANSLVFGAGNDWDKAVARIPIPQQTMINEFFSYTGDTYWVQSTTNAVLLSDTVVTIGDTSPTGDRFNLAICEVRTP